jgi:hypothetical protein
MWTVSGLRSVLGCHENYVVDLVETGRLLWAFDLGSTLRTREIRVLPQCVDDFQAERECDLEWEQVAKLVTPHDKPLVTSLEIQRSCNVTSTHVSTLIGQKQLKQVRKGRTGPGNSAILTSASFLEFLRKRAL